MADENVPAPAPTRSDDQILPFAAWVPIGKSNYVLDLQKKQKNLIFQISVDILQNINFFRAFTASASLDETRFILDANLLREALEITPMDQAHQFVSPPSGDAIMDFVNELGYTEVIHFVSRMAMNNLYQPWRAILSMINQCLTGKTSGHDRPRYLVLQMIWGIITSTNVDYAELMWEEFVQAIQTFLTDKANLGSPTKKGRKDKPHVIPYCRFTKLIIYHLVRIHNIHQKSASPFHLAEEDLRLGNLKFVSKGEVDEVFGMPIPNEMISSNIRNAPYYNANLEMVANHDQKVASEKEGKKKTASAKQPKPKFAKEKPSKPSTAKPPKPKTAKEKSTKATPLQKAGKGKVAKVRKVKSSFQLVDKPDEEPAQPEPEPEPEHQGEGEEYDVERAIQMSLGSFHVEGHTHVGGMAIREPVAEATRPLPIVEGKGKAIVTEEQAAQSLLALHTPKRRNTTDQFIFQRRTPATEEASTEPSAQPQDDTSANIVRDSPSPADAETGAESDKINSGGDTEILQIAEELREDVDKQVNIEERTVELDQDQAGSDPELDACVTALEKKFSDLEQKNKNLNNTTRNLRSKVFTLELRDLPHKIDEAVRESVKEAVHVALQAPLRDRFRELPEADMKEILHQRMFENSTYKSLPKHVALYEALEASMEWANKDKFLAGKEKSRKRQHDDQDPPPPPLNSDPSKKRRHSSDASGSSQPPTPQSSTWKTIDTREAPSSSSKKQFGPHPEQPVEDIPMPDIANISDSEDTDSAYLPKIKPRSEWLKPILEEDKPETLEPDWSVPMNDMPELEKN
ncbi:hypothetical protein Tco_1407248 [Tanacetum coccineum]